MDRQARLMLLAVLLVLEIPVVCQIVFGIGVDPRTGTVRQWVYCISFSIMAVSLSYVILLFINRVIHDCGRPLSEREVMQLRIDEGYRIMADRGLTRLPSGYAELEKEFKRRYGSSSLTE